MKTICALILVCCSVIPASCTVCGLLNNANVQLPPNWDTFMVPAKGQSYVDPVFGCTVTRLTNAAADETAWDGSYVSFMDYYSTFSAINATDTLLFVYSDDGNWRIKDTNANTVVTVGNMPTMNAGHPVWDAANGNVFYYALNNILYEANVSGSSVISTPLHTFSEYSQGVVFPDSADLSQDGDHVALVGQNADNTMDVFIWSLSQQAKTSIYTTTCTIAAVLSTRLNLVAFIRYSSRRIIFSRSRSTLTVAGQSRACGSGMEAD